jgi:hypothetical protein
MKKNALIAVVLSVFFVSGCAQWVKPGASEFEFQQTLSKCRTKAYQDFPQNLVQTPDESEKWLRLAAALGGPSKTGTIGEDLANAAGSLSENAAKPQAFIVVDTNKAIREESIRRCLYANGWQQQDGL